MGNGIGTTQHQRQATHSHQVPSTSGFHGRVPGKLSSNSSPQARALGHVFRRFIQAQLLVKVFSSYLPKVNNSNMFSKSFRRSPTMKPSTRHYCTGYAWRSPSALSDSTTTPCWWFNKSTKNGIATRKQ